MLRLTKDLGIVGYTGHTLAHISICEGSVLWRKTLVIVAMLTKLAQVCTC